MVCGDVATPIATEKMQAPVCQDLDCRRVASKQASMPAFHFNCFLATQSKRIRAQRSAQKATRLVRAQELAARKKIKAAIEAEDETAWWEKIQHHPCVQETPDIIRLVIPKGPSEIIATSDERRETHRDYLIKILQETETALTSASDGEETKQSNEEASNSLAIGLCTACAGGCCTKGGDAAYLTADTMHRVRARFPDLSSAELLQRYVAFIPSDNMVDSCIYHTERGCALPRDLRSDTCNDYACEALRALPPLTNENAEQHSVLVFQRRQDKWRQQVIDRDNSIVRAWIISEDEQHTLDL